MSENTEQEKTVLSEETIVGAEVGTRLKEIVEALKTAEKSYDEAVVKIDEPLDAFRKAAHDVLPRRYQAVDSLITMAQELTAESRNRARKTAQETFEQLRDDLRDEEVRLIDTDPVLSALCKEARRFGYDYHMQMVINALPASFADIKKLADDNDWCTTFEQVFSMAVKNSGLLFDTIEHTCSIDWDDVPYGQESKEGENWEATFKLPVYMRADKYTAYEMQHYAVSASYRRIDA